MDSTKVMTLLENLDDEIDDLEESLQPLLKAALSETASKVPLLDKAKLYVLVTYALESMLFSYLRLNGVKAREHPVFKELTRVKQYFDKIKAIETPVQRTMAVDKAAAARFIKAGLSGNDKYDLVRAEQIAKERAKAHIKFGNPSKDIEVKRKADKLVPAEEESDSSDSVSSSESVPEAAAEPVVSKKKKKRRVDKTETKSASGNSTPAGASNEIEKKFKKSQRSKEEEKKTKKKRSRSRRDKKIDKK